MFAPRPYAAAATFDSRSPKLDSPYGPERCQSDLGGICHMYPQHKLYLRTSIPQLSAHEWMVIMPHAESQKNLYTPDNFNPQASLQAHAHTINMHSSNQNNSPLPFLMRWDWEKEARRVARFPYICLLRGSGSLIMACRPA